MISEECLARLQHNPVDFLRRFITVDETWIHHYSPETKQQSKQWTAKGEPVPKKAKTLRSAGKVSIGMLRKNALARPETFQFILVFARRDEKWRDMRATLSPSFTSSKMRIMFELMDECAREFVQHFKSQNSDTVELEMKDTLRRFTNDVIASTAFGLKINSLKDRKNEFLLMGAAATDFGYIRTMKFLLYTLSPKLCQLLKMKIIPTKKKILFAPT
ncbi:putative cytochrome P450 9f2-like Protein [Tribolium castaneum]|uniref:Putative cytochrome P450 9f2-like Protein n=1 Tax=Tribolium castaneum TaxID=7070 RepID=A0A139W8Y8_TRICA|nr:putative cytochrome P450 9f2-like Protein [Tribolium castaneum]